MFCQVASTYFCAGIVMHDGIVTEAAPILAYMKGWPEQRLIIYCKTKHFNIHFMGPTTSVSPIKLLLLPSEVENIQVEEFTHNSQGKAATAKQLHKITVARLDDGVCIFIFKKKDGAYRNAIGTRKEALIPVRRTAAGSDTNVRPMDTTRINFWDFAAAEWKSFTTESVVAVFIL